LKFESGWLKKFNYNINISFDDAREFGKVVALADNQILRSIRYIRKRTINYEKLEKRFRKRDELKLLPHSSNNAREIRKLQDKIHRTLYIPDYVIVVINHNSHYDYMNENGLYINGMKYTRLSCGAGQARKKNVVFCNTEIIDELLKVLNNDRDITVPLVPSKYNAYLGLAGSATRLVSEPRFIVVKDFENTTSFKANYVIETEWNEDDIVEVRYINDKKMNRTDGMGLISPRQAQKWANELELDYIPSQWCVRQSFLKGMLCTFPIHEFCEEINGGNYIVETIYKDENGEYIKADLRDYDVIITESMFKLWDSYKNTEDYIQKCKKNRLFWGVSQFTPKEPKDILELNYQFIQTLNLNEKQVKELASQFVEWVEGVSYDNIWYMLLYLLGVNNTYESIERFLRSSDNYWLKSLVVNHDLKNDKYIRGKIRQLIKNRIKEACLGKIIVDGNFQVLVSDPYAFMQHVCGLHVTGLLKANEFYSNYWNERGVTQVNSMRSPLTYRSEHVVLNLIKNEQTEKWYRYCKQGIIVNYHGHEVVNWAGADFDFDILATTSNQTLIDGIYKNELPVVYDGEKAPKKFFTDEDLILADKLAFGSIIGSITNKGSNGYALLPLLEQEYGADSDEVKLIESRLKQCCKAQSCQIDKTKIGREVKGIPSVWVKRQEINEDDSLEVKAKKELLNKTLLNRHPYFFIYRYDDTRRRYQDYCSKMDKACKNKFGISIKELEVSKRRTLEQQQFLDGYYKYMPVIISDSTMNLLCRYIEGIDFKISDKTKICLDEEYVQRYKDSSVSYTKETYEQIVAKLREYMRSYKCRSMGANEQEDEDETILKGLKLVGMLNEVCSDVRVVVNCLVDYFYIEKPKSNKDILWSHYGKYLFRNVKQNTGGKIMFPFPDDNGDILYLGKRYAAKEVEI
jgi:hypothetical protein